METTTQLIQDAARLHSAPLDQEQTAAIERYLETLAKWGKVINLTADTNPAVLIGDHLPDALVLSRLLSQIISPTQQPTTVIDVGSGAGLPAIPLAILLPDIHFTLVEARSRRCSFLHTVIHQLGLKERCSLVEQRLEEAALAAHDVAISRATFPPERWLHIGSDLVKKSGTVALLATSAEPVRTKQSTLELVKSCPYPLASGAQRVIMLYQLKA